MKPLTTMGCIPLAFITFAIHYYIISRYVQAKYVQAVLWFFLLLSVSLTPLYLSEHIFPTRFITVVMSMCVVFQIILMLLSQFVWGKLHKLLFKIANLDTITLLMSYFTLLMLLQVYFLDRYGVNLWLASVIFIIISCGFMLERLMLTFASFFGNKPNTRPREIIGAGFYWIATVFVLLAV
jgi:hypothetical protein